MIQALLRETVAEYESRRPTPWKYEVPIEFHHGLARGVLGFEIEILDAVAAFKLSQDKPNPDRWRVADALAASADSAEVEVGLRKLAATTRRVGGHADSRVRHPTQPAAMRR